MKKLIALVLVLGLLGIGAAAGYVFYLKTQLPRMITLADYKPLLVTRVYDRNNQKIGEYSIERRELVPLKDIPPIVVNAFLAAEDSSFYKHGGINLVANLRALLVDLRAGGKVQGASTITQQVARSLLLSNEKTYTRKIKEMFLALEMEKTLTKNDILYLYLNQIYLGQSAYGVAMACKTYFNKGLKDITLPEAAILAGLPKGPSEMNPVHNPRRAKERQRYVLGRMLENKMITRQEYQAAVNAPVKIFIHPERDRAPYFLETVKQMLVAKLGESAVFDDGLKVYTGLDLAKQTEGRKELRQGLRDLDKREGYRGPIGHEEDPVKIAQILAQTRNKLIDKENPYKILQPDGTFPTLPPINLTKYENGTLPDYIHIGDRMKAAVMNVDDHWGLVTVRFAEARGLIDFDSMKWARKPNPSVDAVYGQDQPAAPSQVLKKGDVILVQVVDSTFSSQRIADALNKLRRKEKRRFKMPKDLPDFKHYAQVELDQEPITEAGLLAIDQKTSDIITMVGGYDFARSKLNRTIQTSRQTGSAFKTIVYAAALDKGFTPATQIIDAPVVFDQQQKIQQGKTSETIDDRWTPSDDSRHFLGDVLFRNALIHSMNVPSVKILEKIGIPLAIDYARRLGIFSPLNQDYTLTLGSSSITLYEMTKVFAEFGRLGQRVRPVIVHEVDDNSGKKILGPIDLDEKFETQMKPFEDDFARRRVAFLAYQSALLAKDTPQAAMTAAADAVAKFDSELAVRNGTANGAAPTVNAPQAANAQNANVVVTTHPDKEPPIFFDDSNQLIKPQTAFVITNLLQGVVKSGTGMRARALGRPVAGKTGTTNDYIDAWFLGYTPDIAAGVWVGNDQAASLGKGEVGARAALPIWLGYMKDALQNTPIKDFPVPDGIVFANIDNQTGLLATPRSKKVARQAFISGSEPTKTLDNTDNPMQDFYKQDLSE